MTRTTSSDQNTGLSRQRQMLFQLHVDAPAAFPVNNVLFVKPEVRVVTSISATKITTYASGSSPCL